MATLDTQMALTDWDHTESGAPFSRELALSGLFQVARDETVDRVERQLDLGDGRILHADGSPLSVYDEDTLIGVLSLALENSQTTELMQAALQESAEQLRLLESTARQTSMDDLQERVFASQFLSHDVTAIMTMYAINKFLYANGTGGNSSVLRFKSLLRLAGTMISTTSANRRSHSPMPLIDVYEITDSPHLACQVTISQRVKELMISVIGIDMQLRSELSPIGKILQKLFASEGFPGRTRPWSVSVNQVKKLSGTRQRMGAIITKLESACETMVEHEFIREYRMEKRSARVTELHVN